MNTVLDREQALDLLKEYTKSESLLRHAYSVEASMNFYAKLLNIPEEERILYSITGLLHDFDYEQFPTPDKNGHPFVGAQILRDKGYPENVIEAILGHANYSGVPRETLLAKTLYAVDEASGLVIAAAFMRPDRSLTGLELSSVMKRFKDKGFARGCNRDEIREGAEALGIPLEEHFGNILQAQKEAEIL